MIHEGEEIISHWYKEVKEEIVDLAHSEFFLKYDHDETGRLDVNICEIQDIEKWPVMGRRILQRSPARERTVFCFSTSIHLEAILNQHPEISETEMLRIRAEDITSGLIKNISDIMVLIHVAKPGCIQVDEGIVFINDILVETVRGFHSSGGFVVRTAKALGWPQIQSIPLRKVLQWAHHVPGFRDSIAQTRLGHAIGTLTYLIHADTTNDSTMDIMWIMLGLEALYCSGKSEINRQLKEKTEIYLGERTQHKKKLQQAYDFRSRFAHGDIDFPFSVNPWGATKEYEQFMDEYNDTLDYSFVILLATLQKMCLEDKYALEFEYVIRN